MAEFTNRDALRAILRGDLDKLSEAFASGSSPATVTEKETWNLLHQALLSPVSLSPISSIDYLISVGVGISSVDAFGNTPLHYAARAAHVEAVRSLLLAGANPDLLNGERISPLHQSLLQLPRSLEGIRLLLAASAPETVDAARAYVAAIGDSTIATLFSGQAGAR